MLVLILLFRAEGLEYFADLITVEEDQQQIEDYGFNEMSHDFCETGPDEFTNVQVLF